MSSEREADLRARGPLNGSTLRSFKLVQNKADMVLRVMTQDEFRDEVGIYERVRTRQHTDYPGINVIEMFQTAETPLGEIPPLEEAMITDIEPTRFLLSLATSGVAVVTSRLGHITGGKVTLPVAAANGHNTYFDIRDCEAVISDPIMTYFHCERCTTVGCNPNEELPQDAADTLFREMVSRSLPEDLLKKL